MENCVIEVHPIIEYPPCLKSGKKQDCFSCDIAFKKKCNSPRGMCTLAYPAHKKGCPNYNKRKDCPPNVKMVDEYFDMSKPIYFIIYEFPLPQHIEKMRIKHPNWTERQLRNCLYWQRSARKRLKENVKCFLKKHSDQEYVVNYTPEAMGVNVSKTIAQYGIRLDWPPFHSVCKIALAGVLKENTLYDKEIFEKS